MQEADFGAFRGIPVGLDQIAREDAARAEWHARADYARKLRVKPVRRQFKRAGGFKSRGRKP